MHKQVKDIIENLPEGIMLFDSKTKMVEIMRANQQPGSRAVKSLSQAHKVGCYTGDLEE